MHGGEQSWAERVHSGLPGGLARAQGGRGLTSPPPDLLGLMPPFWPKMLPRVRPTTDVCRCRLAVRREPELWGGSAGALPEAGVSPRPAGPRHPRR